jgi:hypothetical protein
VMRCPRLSPSLFLLAVLVGVSPRVGFAENITIRLINVKDGRPLGGSSCYLLETQDSLRRRKYK